MKLRKLRIAWSAAWGAMATLLIALWVHSYWCWDEIDVVIPSWLQRRIPHQSSTMDQYNVSSLRGQLHAHEVMTSWPQFKIISFRVSEFPATPSWVIKFERGCWNVRCPHWVLVGVISGFAYLPWMRWSKSFSVRTLLILTTVFAVALGMILWATR
jgi:hypothetical protein